MPLTSCLSTATLEKVHRKLLEEGNPNDLLLQFAREGVEAELANRPHTAFSKVEEEEDDEEYVLTTIGKQIAEICLTNG